MKIMGGTVIETESEKLIRRGKQQGQIRMIIELGREDGLDEEVILKRLSSKIGLSPEEARECMETYGKQMMQSLRTGWFCLEQNRSGPLLMPRSQGAY